MTSSFAIPNIHPPHLLQQTPTDFSLWVPYNQTLDSVYYAIACERFGETEILYEYLNEAGAQGNFQVILPYPPNPLNQWLVLIYGYRNGERVLELERQGRDIFLNLS
jgi:hypothetical protein